MGPSGQNRQFSCFFSRDFFLRRLRISAVLIRVILARPFQKYSDLMEQVRRLGAAGCRSMRRIRRNSLINNEITPRRRIPVNCCRSEVGNYGNRTEIFQLSRLSTSKLLTDRQRDSTCAPWFRPRTIWVSSQSELEFRARRASSSARELLRQRTAQPGPHDV